MELVRQCHGSQFLSRAINSLTKVHEHSLIPLPFVSVLVAQAEGSHGSKERWNRNLRLEWYNWPPGLFSTLSLSLSVYKWQGRIEGVTGELNVIKFLYCIPYKRLSLYFACLCVC